MAQMRVLQTMTIFICFTIKQKVHATILHFSLDNSLQTTLYMNHTAILRSQILMTLGRINR